VTEGTTPSSEGGLPNGTGEPVTSGGQSVEEVESFWRNRQSGADRAHAAEVAQLQAQIRAFQQQPSATPAPSGESTEAARVRELEAENAALRRFNDFSTKYPDAVALLGDQVTALPEEKIAALNARIAEVDGTPGGAAPSHPIIDPNAAPRRPAGMPAVRPDNEKSIDELTNDLRALAPAYQEMVRETR